MPAAGAEIDGGPAQADQVCGDRVHQSGPAIAKLARTAVAPAAHAAGRQQRAGVVVAGDDFLRRQVKAHRCGDGRPRMPYAQLARSVAAPTPYTSVHDGTDVAEADAGPRNMAR